MIRAGTAAPLALAILTAVTCAEAQIMRNWQAASSSWFTSANWDPAGVPTPGDTVFIGNGGTASVGSFANPAQAYKVYAGAMGTGTGTLSIASNTLYTPYAYIGGGPGVLQGFGTANVNFLGNWVCQHAVVIGWYAGEGTLNLNNGGRLETGQIMRVLTATGFDPPPGGTVVYGKGRVLFAGGTLRLNADQDKLFHYFFGGDVLLNHSTLGGTIDTQGFAVRCYVGLQGVGPLTKLGSGTLALAGENTYAGGTYVRGGTLKVMGSSLTHNSKDMRLGTQSGDDATLDLTDGTVRNAFGYLGYVAGATGRATVQGFSLWQNGNPLFVGYAGTGTLRLDAGEVRNAAAHVGYNAGSSGTAEINGGLWDCYSLALANNATASGTVRLNAGGTLATTQVSRGSGSAAFEINGGILRIKLTQHNLFSGFTAGQVTLGSGGIALDTLYNVTTWYSLSGSGGLVKQGSGTLVLAVPQGYAGETQISQGALRVDGSVGRVLGLAATTLAGTGTVDAVTLRDGATLAPGAGSASGRLTCASVAGETGRFTLLHRLAAADASRLTVTGAADFSHGTLALQFTAAPATGSSFVLIEKSGAGAMIPFPDIPEGHETVQGGLRLRHTYLAGDGNDFAVTVLNTAPAVAPIADRFMARDGPPPAPVDVAVSDAETAADQLALDAYSDNQTLLPDSALILGGSGENRTLTLAPALGQTGSVSIVVRVSDGDLSAETAFRLTVSPYTELELWRQEHFDTTLPIGPAADGADDDDDGAANLMEFAFALDPHAQDAHLLPQPRREAGAWVYRFTPPPHLASVTYGAQACDSLTTPVWLPVPDSGTPPERVFRLPHGPTPAGFLRLSVRVGQSAPE